VPERLHEPRSPRVQDVVVAQSDAVYAGLIQDRHEAQVAGEIRILGVPDGTLHERVLEIREREIRAAKVVADRARVPHAG
jgi:hypothetical protein